MSIWIGSQWLFTNYKSEKKVQAAVHNALIEETVQLVDKCYVENSWLRGNTVLEKECVISQLELKDVTVPSMVLHGVVLKRDNGEKRYIVRAYGIKDNPKKTLEERGSFLAGDLQSFINLNNLKDKRYSGKVKITLCGRRSFIRL